MADWNKGWTPASVGEAREYLDAHERDGDPDIVGACEAMIDVIEHRPTAGKAGGSADASHPQARPPEDQLEEEGAD